MKILIIAPHPDDEVLGCGGTISKHVNKGDEVYLCIVTKAYTPDWSKEFIETRKREINESNNVLGIKKTYLLNFPTVKLDTVPQKELNASISKVVKNVCPDLLFIPHFGDLNKDHRLIFEASLVSVRPIHSSVKSILSYEVLSETEWGQNLTPFIPNVYVNISKTLSTKIKAMKAYSSEIKQSPHPRSLEGIKTLAKKRGLEAGLNFAEAFILIRKII